MKQKQRNPDVQGGEPRERLAIGSKRGERSEVRRDPMKAKKAAAHPQRPGEECKAAPGTWTPVVNRKRCEGKGDCVEVCPYGVFEVGAIDEAEYAAMPLLNRLKLKVHGKKTALLVNAGACQACGLCVVSCPEKALSLARV